MANTITILSPVPEGANVGKKAGTAAARTLPKNFRVGTLSNGKPNTSHLLDGVLEVLSGHSQVIDAPRLRKEAPSYPAADAIIEQLAREADLVIVATAD